MPLSDFARDLIDAREAESLQAQKAAYAGKIATLQGLTNPPLTTRELSVGLGLQRPDQGGASVIGRFLSSAKRNRRARPDTRTRALIDAILDGALFVAVQSSLPGTPRNVLIVEARDIRWMDRTWTLHNAAGLPIPDRQARDEAWEDGDVFDLFEEDPAPLVPPAPRRIAGRDLPAVGIGTLRLSTAERPDRDQAIATLVAALEAGIRLFDTADSYAQDERDLHYGEALLVEAIEAWGGPREGLLIATKAGLIRPGGRWIPKGDPDHLRASVLRSREVLGVHALPLVLLHAIDPKVPVEESLGALFAMRDEGLIEEVGICNVNPEELARAMAVGPLAAVQIELSLLSRKAMPVLLAARRARIPVMAHRPLGGWKRSGQLGQDGVLKRLAARRPGRITPEAIALGWLISLSEGVLPLVGTTRPATARSSARAATFTLSDAEIQALDDHVGDMAEVRASLREVEPPAEVVLLMGPPAAGKTRAVHDYVERGYLRLNRDERGGRLDDLLAPLDEALRTGTRHVVLDNTYPTRKSRKGVIERARRHGVPVRAVWMETSQRDAMLNACHRMIDKVGRILGPAEITAHPDPNLLPPGAIQSWFARFEAPTSEEGLDGIRSVPFLREARADGLQPGLLLDLDGTVRTSTGPAPFPRWPREVALLPGRRERLLPFVEAGVVLCGITNQAGVGLGQISLEAMQDCVDRTVQLLDLPIDVQACPHAPKASCWCRKPRPGMGVELMRRHTLNPRQTWMIGDRDADRGVARALGVPFFHADDFFSDEGPAVELLLEGGP